MPSGLRHRQWRINGLGGGSDGAVQAYRRHLLVRRRVQPSSPRRLSRR